MHALRINLIGGCRRVEILEHRRANLRVVCSSGQFEMVTAARDSQTEALLDLTNICIELPAQLCQSQLVFRLQHDIDGLLLLAALRGDDRLKKKNAPLLALLLLLLRLPLFGRVRLF